MPSPPARLLTRALVALALGGVVWACASPTLPLPPPETPTVSAGSAPGLVKLSSTRGVLPNAVVVVFNTNLAVPLDHRVGGAQADGQGSWEAEVYGASGDTLDVTQESPTSETRSPPVSVRVP